MKITVLVDNYTLIDEYYFGEPGWSLYIEDGDSKILFDTGYSDIFMANAEKMGIDLGQIDTIVFSHGHNDHTRGFRYFVDEYGDTDEAGCPGGLLKNIKVVAHPGCFEKKVELGYSFGNPFVKEDFGAPYSLQTMSELCQLQATKEPVRISENITYLGEIPVAFDFEERKAMDLHQGDCNYDPDMDLATQATTWTEDKCYDDSALAYTTDNGIFIITGCSHSGICNIIEHAKKVCGDDRILGVMGGFHLFEVDDRLRSTMDYFKRNNIEKLLPAHCVSFHAKAAINQMKKISEVGVGFTLEI